MIMKPTLAFCLIMDLLGFASYLMPVFGDWTDLAWAPVSAFIFYRSFGGKVGKLGSLLNFAEEILPFTDFIPTFTIAYLYKRIFKN